MEENKLITLCEDVAYIKAKIDNHQSCEMVKSHDEFISNVKGGFKLTGIIGGVTTFVILIAQFIKG